MMIVITMINALLKYKNEQQKKEKRKAPANKFLRILLKKNILY